MNGNKEKPSGRAASLYLSFPLIERCSCRVPPRSVLRFAAHRAAELVGSRPTASSFLACPRKEPKKGTRGFAPATPTPPPVGLRPKSAAPRPRISERAYSIPPAAAPQAQCLCPGVSGTVLGVRLGRHVRFCMARSAHGEAENCAASPRTHAERANARNGRCFPPCVPGEPSGVRCWERPQPELSLQLVYPWGAAVVCGLWQGTPGDT